jgi:hypothetical protein
VEFREKSCSLPYLKNFSKLEGPYKSGRHPFWDLQLWEVPQISSEMLPGVQGAFKYNDQIRKVHYI